MPIHDRGSVLPADLFTAHGTHRYFTDETAQTDLMIGNLISGADDLFAVEAAYPTDGPFDFFQRSWDLGLPLGRTYPPFTEGGPEVRTGGGGELARFLLDDARSFLSAEASLDPGNQALFGHSLGGLFTLWLMLTRPVSFRAWSAASPAITWEDSFLLAHLAGFQPAGYGIQVHLSSGEWEGDTLAPFQEGRPGVEQRLREKLQTRTTSAAMEFAAVLSEMGVEAEYETIPGETHMSVLPTAVNRAVRCAFCLDYLNRVET